MFSKMHKRKNDRIVSILASLAKGLDDMHLYDNKWEALMKAIVFLMSLFLGVYPLTDGKDIQIIGAAYLVFGFSITMEYVPPMIDNKKRFLSAFLPMVLIFINILILVASFAYIGGKQIVDIQIVNILAYVTVGLIAGDALVYMANGSLYLPVDKVENKLKKVNV